MEKTDIEICDNNPEFAIICSFINQFGSNIDIELDIEKLKSSIENQDSLDEYLFDIKVKLLKKIRRYFVSDHWEKALIGYAAEYSFDDAHQIECNGYLKSSTSTKLELLGRLLEAQFECDQNFKTTIAAQEAEELRIQPTGRDNGGNTYWHIVDKHGAFRVFKDDPVDFKRWQAICRTIDDLRILIIDLNRLEGTRSEAARSDTSDDEDKPCSRCDKSNDPESILLCDMCDDGYHLACCIPPLMIIPDGDWFCPSCEHKTLLNKLNEILTYITQLLESKERERMKRARLRQAAAARRQQAQQDALTSDKQRLKLKIKSEKDDEEERRAEIKLEQQRQRQQRYQKKLESSESADEIAPDLPPRPKRPVLLQDDDDLSDLFSDESQDQNGNGSGRRQKANSDDSFKAFSDTDTETEEEDEGDEENESTEPETSDVSWDEVVSKGRRGGKKRAKRRIASPAESYLSTMTETEEEDIDEELVEDGPTDVETSDASLDEIAGSFAQRKQILTKKRVSPPGSDESSDFDGERTRRRAATQQHNYKEITDESEVDDELAVPLKQIPFYQEDEVRPLPPSPGEPDIYRPRTW